MHRRFATFALAGVIALLIFTSTSSAEKREEFRYPEGRAGAGSLKYLQGTPVMFLQGTPAEIGEQQGKLVGGVIEPLVQMPKLTIEHHGVEKYWPFVVGMANVVMENSSKDHHTELDALIESSGRDRNSLYVANSLVELRRMGGCASFAVMPPRSQSGRLLFGRNFDFPPLGVLDTYHCLLIVQAEGKHAYASVGYPGLIGVISGMNDAGLTVATLDVYESADGSPYFDPQGVPLALTYRRILEECTTVAEARKLLEETKRTTYMNLAVCDAKSAAIFELTPGRVGVREPEENILSCTNHFRLEGLLTDTDCSRYDTLTKLREGAIQFDVAGVQKAMHAVNQGHFTLQTMVFEPETLTLHLAMGGPGPVSNQTMKKFALKELFAELKKSELPPERRSAPMSSPVSPVN